MTSNQDILAFLKAAEDARAKEKEDDKVTRGRERQEDRDNIVKMIKIGIQKEVREALQEVEQRLGQQEQVNQELEKQVNLLVKEIETLKEAAVNNQQSNLFPAVTTGAD